MAPSALPDTLDGWLAHIERGHPQSIAMGLDRVRVVRNSMALVPPSTMTIFTVGGTNGKGSACMMLESIWLFRTPVKRLSPLRILLACRVMVLPHCIRFAIAPSPCAGRPTE